MLDGYGWSNGSSLNVRNFFSTKPYIFHLAMGWSILNKEEYNVVALNRRYAVIKEHHCLFDGDTKN